MEGLTVQGDRQVISKLHDLENKVARRHLRTALRAGAAPIRDAAKADAPSRTGLLASEIKIKAGRSGGGIVSVMVTIGKKAFYGAFVNSGHFLGHRLRGKFNEKNYHQASLAAGRKFVPGKHFMDRAYESKKREAVDITQKTLFDLIEQE